MKRLVALLMVLAPCAATCQEWTGTTCIASLERAYSVFAVRPDTSIQGDFNGDGGLDFAVLLDGKAHKGNAAIGVCLSREARPLIITHPYQSTKIVARPKGTA